jgi:hypothetical protein
MNTNQFDGVACRLEGAGDIKYPLINLAIIIGMVAFAMFFVACFFFHNVLGALYLVLIGAVGLYAVYAPALWFGAYMPVRKSYICFDKNGVSGKARMYGESGLETAFVEFSYTWEEVSQVLFGNDGNGTQIAFVVNDTTVVYRYSYRFVRHEEVLEAIRTFGGEAKLDKENIEETAKHYSLRRVLLRSVLWAVFAVAAILLIVYRAGGL